MRFIVHVLGVQGFKFGFPSIFVSLKIVDESTNSSACSAGLFVNIFELLISLTANLEPLTGNPILYTGRRNLTNLLAALNVLLISEGR